MDSLIRLETTLPNASLNENAGNLDDMIMPDNILNPHLTNGVTVIGLSEEPEWVEITNVEHNQRLQPSLEEAVAIEPNSDSPPVIVIEEGVNAFLCPNRSPVKHKLPESPNHRSSKVPKTSNNVEVPFSLAANIQHDYNNTCLPSTSSLKPPLNTLKNHTITSGAISNDLPLAGTSRETHLEKEHNVHENQRHYSLHRPKPITNDGRPKLRSEKENENSMVYQLLDMFPDINLQFLKDQCQTGSDLNEITEKILNMDNYPRDNKPIEIPDTSDELTNPLSASGNTVDPGPNKAILSSNNSTETIEARTEQNISESQFRFLMEIFPDADPNFMEIKCKLRGNELSNFITECTEKSDYPKVTALVKQEACEVQDESTEIGLYTSDFNLESFLKIFSNPFEYFLAEKRNCQFSEHGLEFLKRRYRCHSIKLILKMYKELKYNLVKTCEYLDGQNASRVTKRSLKEIKMPDTTNLPFLQEACFIEHKDEIKKYLDRVSEAKRLAYEQAEAKGELIECGCCYQNVMFEDCAACNEGHLFCKTCVRKSVDVRIGDGLTSFPCLQDCDSIFSLKLLETLVDATMFSRLLQRIQIDEVRAADIEGLEVCPFCDFAIILPSETNIFKCLNPECLKESCRKCHRLSHIPQRCEELESDEQAKARKYIEDEMTRALVRECYKCKKSFIKIDGCNKMTCTCGAKMCYICRQPIVDYKHFNGPGGEEKEKCPLYSTEKLLHVDAVEAVAKKALEEVTSKNPELKLKHDPTKVLPSTEKVNNTLPPGVNEEGNMLQVLQNFRQIAERLNEVRANHYRMVNRIHHRRAAVYNYVRINPLQIPQNMEPADTNVNEEREIRIRYGFIDNPEIRHLIRPAARVNNRQDRQNMGPAARVIQHRQDRQNMGPAARVIHQPQNRQDMVEAAAIANQGRVIPHPLNHQNVGAAAISVQERVIHNAQNHQNLGGAADVNQNERVGEHPQNHQNPDIAAVPNNQDFIAF